MSTLADEPALASCSPPRNRVQRGRALLATLRRVPTAAWVCALVALLNGACWSVISPPFQLPDEPSHFAYAQHLAQTGQLPSSNGHDFPAAEQTAMNYLHEPQVRFSPENHTIGSIAQQRALESALRLPYSRSQPGDAGEAAAEPPLYYALETIPYLLGSGGGAEGTLLDSLALMRLLSVVFGGLTALFCFLFVRELLPGARWAWTVGGLAVALTPILGMMSGAVNPDALVFAISSALFYSLARAFRRGLTSRRAVAIGAIVGAGCVTQVIFFSLVPGAIVALAVLAVREARVSGRAAYGRLALALFVAALPLGTYLLVDAFSSQLTLKFLDGGVAFSGQRVHKSVFGELAYTWQMFLPRLPGMTPALHGISADRIWYEQLVGKYGWLDTTFPSWVVSAALLPVGAVTVLFVRALLVSRHVLWEHRTEILVYALICLGVLGIIGADDYRGHVPGEYLQLRYLTPMIALAGVGLALTARAAGRRWGPLVGTTIVLLVLAHDLFSQLLVVSRYYG